jgi:hypothetical protein
MSAVPFRRRLEEAAAFAPHGAPFALSKVDVFPIRDRPPRRRPEPAVKNAQLVIVDRGVQPGECKESRPPREVPAGSRGGLPGAHRSCGGRSRTGLPRPRRPRPGIRILWSSGLAATRFPTTAQFGSNSDQAESVGRKKPSEYKTPQRRSKKSTGRTRKTSRDQGAARIGEAHERGRVSLPLSLARPFRPQPLGSRPPTRTGGRLRRTPLHPRGPARKSVTH